MNKNIKVNEKEGKVLKVLAEDYDSWGESGFYAFSAIASMSGLTIPEVRRACRSLARKGLAKYERGLWNEDGPAGAGYGATEEGATSISPCDWCGKLSSYDWEEDAAGNLAYQKDFNKETAKRHLECEDCYEDKKKTK